MVKESICRSCFHSYVCEQFDENRDDNNEKCRFFNDHYAPTADIVEVVRCKDCKFWTPMDDGISWQNKGRTDGECQFLWQRYHAERHLTEKDHFCSYGERKE